VLTLLPQPYTVTPVQASSALRSYSTNVLVLPGEQIADAIGRFAVARASGGASYGALIAVTANEHSATLLTRDERAAEIYERLGTDVRWVST
jgi:predicted nucleic acid-binding protein